MQNCIEIPGLGYKCLGDLAFEFAGYQVNLAHPGWGAGFVILLVLLAFVFKSPVQR